MAFHLEDKNHIGSTSPTKQPFSIIYTINRNDGHSGAREPSPTGREADTDAGYTYPRPPAPIICTLSVRESGGQSALRRGEEGIRRMAGQVSNLAQDERPTQPTKPSVCPVNAPLMRDQGGS